MTREEKQKAIDALKISTPVMAVTQEEFNDYIQTLNKIMDWLEQDTVPFDFELYQAGLMDMPKGMIEVLDKIRAEIKEESRFCPLTEGLERALEIIDKYTAEKE